MCSSDLWAEHPLGRPILGTKQTVDALTSDGLRQYFEGVYTAPNLIVAVVGNIEHEHVRALIERAFADLPRVSAPVHETPPRAISHTTIRTKDLEQSHVCLGASAYRQNHDDRYGCYVLNTILGGSMSSRLFQNVREKRGLA